MTTVFLHGLGQTPESWDAVLNALGLSDCRYPSLPGLVYGQKPTYQKLYAAFSAYYAYNLFNFTVFVWFKLCRCTASFGTV